MQFTRRDDARSGGEDEPFGLGSDWQAGYSAKSALIVFLVLVSVSLVPINAKGECLRRVGSATRSSVVETKNVAVVNFHTRHGSRRSLAKRARHTTCSRLAQYLTIPRAQPRRLRPRGTASGKTPGYHVAYTTCGTPRLPNSQSRAHRRAPCSLWRAT